MDLIPNSLSAFVRLPPSQGLRRDKTAGQAGIQVFLILQFSGTIKPLETYIQSEIHFKNFKGEPGGSE